jgi:hypothetical protein
MPRFLCWSPGSLESVLWDGKTVQTHCVLYCAQKTVMCTITGWQLWHQTGSKNSHKLFSIVAGQCCWDGILWAWPEGLSCHGNGKSWSLSFCCSGRQKHDVGCAWSLDTRRCSNSACGLWNCELKNKTYSEVLTSQSIVTRLSSWQPKNLGSIPTAGKRLFMDWLPLKVTETIFFLISGITHQWHIVKSHNTWIVRNIFYLDWCGCLWSQPFTSICL